jgi:tetratricopeptide (TPR) repeat protein
MPDPDILKELERRKVTRRVRDLIAQRLADAAARPNSIVALHNLAGALGDAGLWREAADRIERAFRLGADAPESWLIRARALMELGRFAAAQDAYQETLRRRPGYHDAHRELAQLIWRVGGEVERALVPLRSAIRHNPNDIGLRVLEAHVLETAGLNAEAHGALLALAREQPNDLSVAVAVSQSALAESDFDTALTFAESALLAAPASVPALIAYANACLAAGRNDRAGEAASRVHAQDPMNQNALALQATAWRLAGDFRYAELYDYRAFVRSYTLAAPPGWSSVDAYVADLAQALRAAHTTCNHPFGQSIKQGTQATTILDHDHPALRALPAALDPPIRQYLEDLGPGADPHRSRNRGDYAIHGVWSIRMSAGGRHVDHVHPQGWISSACYLVVPDAPEPEGWLKLGEPGARTPTPCPPELFVQPAPGKLVLFPSYMWHGTVPFSGEGERLTFAFDLIEP